MPRLSTVSSRLSVLHRLAYLCSVPSKGHTWPRIVLSSMNERHWNKRGRFSLYKINAGDDGFPVTSDCCYPARFLYYFIDWFINSSTTPFQLATLWLTNRLRLGGNLALSLQDTISVSREQLSGLSSAASVHLTQAGLRFCQCADSSSRSGLKTDHVTDSPNVLLQWLNQQNKFKGKRNKNAKLNTMEEQTWRLRIWWTLAKSVDFPPLLSVLDVKWPGFLESGFILNSIVKLSNWKPTPIHFVFYWSLRK